MKTTPKKIKPVKLSGDEIDDLLSALSFFMDKYPDRDGSVVTRKAMGKLSAKLWKALKAKK